MKTHKHLKFLILIIWLTLTLLASFSFIPETEASPYEALTISGRYWTNSTGNPVLLRGVCYPHHENGALWTNYDSAEIESNLTEIASYGFNLVVLQVGMDVFESERGNYTNTYWTNLQDILTRIKNKDMYAMLRTPDYCSASSGWVNKAWNETNWYWGNQTFRDDQGWFLKNLTYKIYNDWSLHQAVVGIDVWSEADCYTANKKNFFGYWQNSNATFLQNGNASWKAWLEAKYGTVSAVNDTWKHAKYSSELGSESTFDEIGVPNSTHCSEEFSARRGDYQLWMLETFYNITKLRRDACKTYYNFSVGGSISGYIWRTQDTATAKRGHPKNFLEESHIADLCDIIMVDSYGVMSGDFQTLATYHRRWNKPMMGIEYGIKTTDYTLSEQKEFWTEAYGSMLTQGIAASAIWCWMDNSPTYGYGLTEVDGDNKAILSFLNTTHTLVETVQGELDQLLFDDDIAIVMSQTTKHKLGITYSWYGFFSIAPIEFARMNIYPTVVFEAGNATAMEQTILKADTLSTLNNYDILVWQPIDASFQWNSTWWNQTFVPSSTSKIFMGLASCTTGEYQPSSDDYGWDFAGASPTNTLNLTLLPYTNKRNYGSRSVPSAGWYDNATCHWGSYSGQNVKWHAYDTSPLCTDPDVQVEGDATSIINVTIGGEELYAVVANSEVYVNLLPLVQDFRFWHPLGTGESDERLNEDYNCTILRTALDWFNYTARFNSTNPYVRTNILNGASNKYVVFSNPMNTSQSLTWKLNNLTDYSLGASTNYTLTWIHNSTELSGNYTGNQLQTGLDFTVENQTISILQIAVAEGGNGNGNGDGNGDPPELPPVLTGDTATVTWYMREDTHTVNGVTGYAVNTTATTLTYRSVSSVYSGSNVTVYWGWRVWLVRSDNASTELTSGSPVAVASRTASGSGLQSATWTPDNTRLNVGFDAVKLIVYIKMGATSWEAKATFATNRLLYKALLNSTWSFNVYTTKQYITDTTGFVFWGSASYNTTITNVQLIIPSVFDMMLYNLQNQDLVGFITYPFTNLIGTAFWGLAMMLILVPTYNRYKSFTPILIMCIIFGGVGGAFSLLIPEAGMGIMWVFLLFGLAGVLYRVFR